MLKKTEEGEEYESLGKLDLAEQCYREAIELASKEDDSDSLAWASYILARRFSMKGGSSYDEAISLLNQALTLSGKATITLPQPRVLNLLGLIHYYKNDLLTAGARLNQSFGLIKDDDSPEDLAQYYHYIGLVHYKEGERKASEDEFEKALQTYWGINDLRGVSRVYDSMANLEAAQGNLKDAGYYISESIKIKEEMRDRQGLAISYGGLGRLRMSQGRFTEAEAYLRADLELSEGLGDLRGIGIMLNNLGELYGRSGQFEKSLEFYNRNLSQVGGELNTIFANLGIAKTYIVRSSSEEANKKDLHHAKDYLDKAKELTKKFPENALYDNSLNALTAMILWHEGKWEEAEKLLTKVGQVSHGQEKLDILVDLGGLYESRGDKKKALETLESTFPILEAYGANNLIRKMEERISRIDREALLKILVSRYLPKQIIPSFFDGGEEIRNPKRCEVSILYTDIRGFTSMSEGIPPGDVVATLDDYFGRMVEVVKEHNGTLDKFIGDAIMVIYGAPETPLDHAKRAVLTGLTMIEKLKELNRERKIKGLDPLEIGVGINSGEAVVGSIGTLERMDYTAIGDTVNTASRLEGLNKEYNTNIIISEYTLSRLMGDRGSPDLPQEGLVPAIVHPRGWVRYNFVDEVKVKGKARSLKIYTLWVNRFVRFKTKFIRYGETLEPKPGILALDVGGKTIPGVIDHHQSDAEEECSASLVYKHPHLITDHIRDMSSEDVEIITHENPDLDAIVAAYFSQELIEKRHLPPVAQNVAQYAKRVDSGRILHCEQLENTPYGIMAGIAQLNQRYAKEIGASQQEKDRLLLERGVQLVQYLFDKMEAGADIDDPELFEGQHPFIEEQRLIRNDYFSYLEDRDRGIVSELEIPTQDGRGAKKVKALTVKSPTSSMFKVWARNKGHTMTVVNYDDKRYIISVDPGAGLALKGLGAALDLAETKKRTILGMERRGPPRPGYPNSDPWYDGRSPIHKFTIVDTPRNGTVLNPEEIIDITMNSKSWMNCGWPET